MNKKSKSKNKESDKVSESKEEEKLYGIGGWLLLLVIILIGNTLYFVYDIISSFYVVMDFPLMWIVLIVELGVVILFGLSLVYLFEYNKKGVEILRFALWLPLANYVLIYIMYWLLKIDLSGDVGGDFFYGFFRNFIFAIIWFSYLGSSKRVHNTYYKNKR